MFNTFSMRRALTLGAIASALPMLASSASAQSLSGAGSTFINPMMSKWAAVYNQQTRTQINYQSVGSGAGIQQLRAQTVDFGASDAPLSNADLTTMPGRVVQVPIIAGAVAVVVNGQPNGIKLTGPVVADIFAGKIRRWNDPRIAGLNPGLHLAPRAIAVAHRSDGSGTTAIFTNYLSSASPSWKGTVGAGKSVDWPVGQGGKGNEGVAALVKSTGGSIGYVELAYAKQSGMAYAAVQNRSGKFVLPSVGGVMAAEQAASKATARDVRSLIVNQGGNAYPISGYTFIMFYANQKNTPKGKQLVKFLNWAMGPGQGMASSLYYAPLPRSVVSTNKQKLR